MAVHALFAPSIPYEEPSWRAFSDAQLVAAFRGECGVPSREDAAEELFRRHQSRITRWCCRFTHDRESAADLAQEILLRAYRNLHKYRGECRFSTWLYVIARNLCFTALQRRACEPVWIARSQATEFPDTLSTDIHDAFETEQKRLSNWNFILKTLDKMEARVMLLHYGEELPLSTVSRILGLTNKSGAKAYIVSARRKLSAAMDSRKRPVKAASAS